MLEGLQKWWRDCRRGVRTAGVVEEHWQWRGAAGVVEGLKKWGRDCKSGGGTAGVVEELPEWCRDCRSG